MTRPAAAAIAASRRTTVVLPLDPVTSTTGTSRTRDQSIRSGAGRSLSGQQRTPVPDPTDTVSSPLRKVTPRECAALRMASSAGLRSPAIAWRSRSAAGPNSGSGWC